MSRKVQRNPFEKPVHFTQDELVYIRGIAEKRQAAKENASAKLRDNRIVERDNVELHFIGLLGEVAVAKLVHGFPDLRAYLGGGGVDLTIFGTTVEVKCLKGYMAFKSLAHFTADTAALTIYDPSDLSCLWVQGWTTRELFIEEHFIDDFGYGPRPVVQPSALLPIETLRTFALMGKMFGQILKDKRALEWALK